MANMAGFVRQTCHCARNKGVEVSHSAPNENKIHSAQYRTSIDAGMQMEP
jgi:hypothetical protein